MEPIEFEYVTWEQVTQFIDMLAAQLATDNITGIYGIPRGGLIFAVMLSHKINKPLLMAPCEGCLIIDDIADTGKTLQHYDDEDYTIATMYYHKQSLVIPRFYMLEKTDKWIVYPWEQVL